ncbi:MAG: PEP-CTERM sorting domain-containing protein [Gemmatimonadales bacterium]
MKRTAIIAVSAVLISGASSAVAQDVLPRPLGPMESFRFTSGSGVGASWGSVQIGPYHGVMTSDPTQPQVTLYCVDFAHTIHNNQTWNANITTLEGTDFGNTRANDVAKYKKAAFLSSLFDSYSDYVGVSYGSGTFGNKKQVWSGLHAAIWTIMTPGFGNPWDPFLPDGQWVTDKNLADAMAAPFLALADAAMRNNYAGTGMDFGEWSVVSDKCIGTTVATTACPQVGGVQEYLVHTVVPEPETVVLMMTGLLALAVGAFKFRMLDTG